MEPGARGGAPRFEPRAVSRPHGFSARGRSGAATGGPRAVVAAISDNYSCTRRNRSALTITDTELNVIAALAQIGAMRIPKNG